MFLNCHTYFSLRYGIMSPELLITKAKESAVGCLAITDINNSTAVLDVYRHAQNEGIRIIAGIDFHIKDEQKYIGIAENEHGFHALNQFLSKHNLTKTPLPERAPYMPYVRFIYPLHSFPIDYRADEYAAVQEKQLNFLQFKYAHIPKQKQLILHPVCFAAAEDFELHKHLRAIDRNTLLSKLNEEQLASPDASFLPEKELKKRFSAFPYLFENTQRFCEKLGFHFDNHGLKNKKCFTSSSRGDYQLLKSYLDKGLIERYGSDAKIATDRAYKELEVIHQLGFSAYFLITHDIISFSMKRGFYHVGRGSGANSIVAYCLRITDVDPIELDLYFERFINKARSSPPDFDIDYSWKERDEVLDYIFRTYGASHAALLGVNSTFRSKSIYRELGKVYGLPKNEIDRLVEQPDDPLAKTEINFKIHRIAQKLADFPNIRSIHAGGVLISEKPITYYGALDMPPKGFPTVQWDMYLAESIGFEKIDILSQRGIGHIRDAVELIAVTRGESIDIHNVKDIKRNERALSLLRNGETIGCFYIESPAMRGLLKKLHCSDYITLVAASSIIRPGVARSGMMKEYIKRFHHPEKIEYLHPVMKEQLGETYGVMVYQEDVLKVCHHYAGLDLTDADVLRRAMSGKYRSKTEFQKIIERFFAKSREKGRPEQITKEVWRQIESFAGYSFSKAHSASYAVESFQSLYLKAHYPLEFMTAVLNNFGGFYHSWVYFNEFQRLGGRVEAPCVNHSEQLNSLHGSTVYVGFTHLKSLEQGLSHMLVSERKKNGSFYSLDDFMSRIPAGKEQMILLIRCGAFRFTGTPKPQLLWMMHMQHSGKSPKSSAPELFKTPARSYRLPPLKSDALADAYDEMELLGFPVSTSMFDLLKTNFRGEIMAGDMNNNIGQNVRMLGRLVALKYAKTIRGEMMHFATFVDVHGQLFDSVHFPPVLKNWPFKGYGIYLLYGRIVEEFSYPIMEVQKMALMHLRPDPRME